MGQLTRLRATKGQAAEDKWPRMEGEFLFALVPLIAGELDGIELPEPAFRYRDGGKTRANCGRDGGQESVSVRVSVDPAKMCSFFRTHLPSPHAGILSMIGVSPGLTQQELGGRLRILPSRLVSLWMSATDKDSQNADRFVSIDESTPCT